MLINLIHTWSEDGSSGWRGSRETTTLERFCWESGGIACHDLATTSGHFISHTDRSARTVSRLVFWSSSIDWDSIFFRSCSWLKLSLSRVLKSACIWYLPQLRVLKDIYRVQAPVMSARTLGSLLSLKKVLRLTTIKYINHNKSFL